MRRPLALLLPLVLAASAAFGLTITQSASPPESSSALVFALDAPSDLGSHPWVHGSGIAINLGQTFRLASPVLLDRVTVKARATTDIGNELVTLWIGEYGGATDATRDELLRVEYAPLPADLPVGEVRYLTFELGTPVPLLANQQYGFELGFSGGGGVNDARAELLHLGGDLYAAGTAYSDFGGFADPLAEDLAFFLEGTGEAPAPRPDPDPDEILLLRDGRFEVVVYWHTVQGGEGYGQPVAMTPESGCFWFFAEDNLEIFLKVLDACAAFDRYWVFVAGLTDVEVEVTVRDLEAGAVWSFANPMGEPFPPVLDANALATCP